MINHGLMVMKVRLYILNQQLITMIYIYVQNLTITMVYIGIMMYTTMKITQNGHKELSKHYVMEVMCGSTVVYGTIWNMSLTTD